MAGSIKLGSILLYKRGGFWGTVLYYPMRFIDPDPWVRANRDLWGKYWHMAIVVGWNPKYSDWVVRSIEWGGAKYKLLSEFKDKPTVVNWIKSDKLGADQDEINEYIRAHPCTTYDGIGYLVVTANRLSRGLFPAREKKQSFYCWSDVSEFCEFFGTEWMPYGEMAYMPVFVKLAYEKGLIDERNTN